MVEASDEDWGRGRKVGTCSSCDRPISDDLFLASVEGLPISKVLLRSYIGLPGSREGLLESYERPGSSEGRVSMFSGLREEVEGLEGGDGGA